MRKGAVLPAVTLVLGLLLALGVMTFLHPCGVHADGAQAACYAASRWLIADGAAVAALSLLRVFLKGRRMRIACDCILVLLGVAAVLLPGTLLPVCSGPMAGSMACNTAMKPGALVIGVLTAVLSLTGLAMDWRRRG